MDISRLLTDITGRTGLAQAKNFYDSFYDPEKWKDAGINVYPDGSRSFDDLFVIICLISTASVPVVTSMITSLPRHKTSSGQARFEDGFLSPFHKHNYVELAYVAEGQLKQKIEDHDVLFNKGEICLIGKDASHADYLYKKDMIVVFLGISNSFFDKSFSLDGAKGEAEHFLRDMMIGQKKKYNFVRFVPKSKNTEIPAVIEQILSEMTRPRPGGTHLIMGYMERLLNLLPQEYRISIQGQGRTNDQRLFFDEILQYLEEHYQDVSINTLIEKYGHTVDYYGRLINRHTGMTSSRFLQNIRLEYARILLKTTGFSIDDIAHRVGYENLGYFYRIFVEKYQKRPNELRKDGAAP
jgi:AraC-like DNA-binding protein/quercetin dioxygenase-like cupin family protein